MKNNTTIVLIIFFLVIMTFGFYYLEDKRAGKQEQHSQEIEQLTQSNQDLIRELNRQKYLVLLIYNHANAKSMKKDTILTRIMLTGDNQ
jgi:hypothetical protein